MKRRALTIGINNYPNAQLNGCVNDANDWARLWQNRGFDSVDTLLDGDATKANIVASLKAQVALMRYRDTLVVCYSGHGSWVPDQNGDEADGRDEVWVAQDYQNGGLILDDELFEIFSARRYGTRIIVLSDSCFSGTVNKFVALPGAPEWYKERNRPEPKVRFLPPGHFLPPSMMVAARDAEKMPAKGKSRPGAVLISGCSETEYSYDASFLESSISLISCNALPEEDPLFHFYLVV